MKTRILNLTMAVVFSVMFISGCASTSMPSSLKSDKLLESESDSIEMRFEVARTLERNGQLAKARKSYLEILNTQSHSPSLHRLVVIAVRQNRSDEELNNLAEAGALANLALIQSQSGNLEKARKNYSKALDLDPNLKVAAAGLLEVDKHINKNATSKQGPELEIEEMRFERQASWNQPVEFSSSSEPEPKQDFDRMAATKLRPLMDRHEDIDDVTQQISAIEKEIRVRQERSEKREELARLQEANRRLELAELEELATRLKLAEREDIVERLELAERRDSVNRDEAAKLDPMSSITKLIEENKRIRKRTSQPAE